MPKLNKKTAEKILKEKAESVTKDKLHKLVKNEDKFEKKLETAVGSLGKFVNRLKLLFELIKDYHKGEYRKLPWRTIAMAGTAVLYFVNPFDIVPDFIPGIGYVDDAMVISACFWGMKKDLKTYLEFKGYPSAKYF